MKMSVEEEFRQRFLAGTRLCGSFLKIAHTMPAEILGALGYDFVVIDEEHAPINRESTDRMILACRATEMAALVRVQSADPAAILSVLDCGAAGILVPHVDSPAKARAVVAAARYRGGSRGYSATTRAGAFGGASLAGHLDAQDSAVTVIAMIEDPAALDVIDEIIATPGLDGVFVGRGDLTVAFGQTRAGSPPVLEATDTIIAAAQRAGKPVCMMVGSAEDAAAFAAAGASAFILASDQTFLRAAALKSLSGLKQVLASPMKKET